jgi:hypothetical protein
MWMALVGVSKVSLFTKKTIRNLNQLRGRPFDCTNGYYFLDSRGLLSLSWTLCACLVLLS